MSQSTSESVTRTLTFIQYDLPPLKSGRYTLTATQTVNQPPPNSFTATRVFDVGGNRFQLAGDDIVTVFPPANANGEFSGVLPNVVLKRCKLPWQRTSVAAEPNPPCQIQDPHFPLDTPWLAVLLLEASEMPTVHNGVAADVIAAPDQIFVLGTEGPQGTGTMPAGTFSYPDINPLDYGQGPTTPCSYIDLSVELFSKVAPSACDLAYLAHIREVDTTGGPDDTTTSREYAIVLGNRVPSTSADAYGVLVSLENMGPYLPDDSGNPSTAFPAGTTTVRLLTYRNWRFFVNDMDESFQNLAESLNKDSQGVLGQTTVRIDAPATTSAAVAQAITDEATALTGADADALVLNALAAGYLPLDHHLREAGDTVSWYRGPLLPYGGTTEFIDVPAYGPDALLRYDPYTGMFDTSYAAAWQLGQLLALQSTAYSTTLYQWKKQLGRSAAAQAEQALLEAHLGNGEIFPSFTAARQARTLAAVPPIPGEVSDFIGGLRLLVGVPFNWLVPNESMLPQESFRLFSLDPNWVEALVDGAYSIGRATEGEHQQDAEQMSLVRTTSAASARARRLNDPPHLAQMKLAASGTTLQTVTGVLLRSQLVPGWPKLNINGYSDTAGLNEVPKLRMEQLSTDVILCLFDGVVAMVAIHEAPEQLHCGVEMSGGTATTTLRQITGDNPGGQYLTDPKGGPASAAVPLRADGQTLQVAGAANSVFNKLNSDFSQNLSQFTSAEFALEFIKGVVKVEYVVGD